MKPKGILAKKILSNINKKEQLEKGDLTTITTGHKVLIGVIVVITIGLIVLSNLSLGGVR